ncbi:SCAN box domain-containing protein [Trichonephila clavipes]|nr:SCAN box domain-containing protein [Trichonephila clavipes]
MAYFAKGNKLDLLSVCEEMGVEVDQSSKVVDIKKLILNSQFYVEEEMKIIPDRVISDRKEQERSKQKEREEKSKQEEKEREERDVENSEKLKQCFYRHQKSAEKSWRNYAHELNSYFTERIAELQLKTFEQLKYLLITEQLKYRVPVEVREHFLDDWIKLKTPYELAEKLDEYESIKQSFRREIPKKNSYKFQGSVNYSGARPKETPKDFKFKFQIKKEPVHEKNHEKDFEKSRQL